MGPTRDLLFGMLALRTNLLDADRFSAMCQRWANQKDKPLADLLVERGWLSDEDRSHVEYLVHRNVEQHGGDAQATFKALADASVCRALAVVDDPELRSWMNATLPGSALLDPDVQPSKRGLGGVGVAVGAVVGVLLLVGLLGVFGMAWMVSQRRMHMEMARAEAEMVAARAAEDQHRRARAAVAEALKNADEALKNGQPALDRAAEVAAKAAVALADNSPENGQLAYDAACQVANLVPLAEKDGALPEVKRTERANALRGQAVELLTKAETVGFFKSATRAELLRKEKAFDALREQPQFLQLLQKVGVKKE